MGGRGASSGIAVRSNITGAGVESDNFFGKIKKISNQYFKFDQYQDNDNVIVITNNLTAVKGDPVLVTGEHTAVYLNTNQFRAIEHDGLKAYAVKINRSRFKEYTFKGRFDFEGNRDTFDSLVKLAKKQQTRGQKWKSGGRTIITKNALKSYKKM